MSSRWFCALALIVAMVAPVAAGPDVLATMPADTGIVIVVDHPRSLVETAREHEAYQAAKSLPIVRNLLDSTPARRLFQLIAYYERDLGAAWPILLDKLAGNGLALGTTPGDDPAPTLLIVRGTDTAATSEFFPLAIKLLEQETIRAGGEAAAKLVTRATYKTFDTVTIGDDFHAARAGGTIYLANRAAILKSALDLAAGTKGAKAVTARSGPATARTLLGGEPLGWFWFDFAKTHQTQGAKDFFAATRKDFLQTIVVGSTIDAARRSDLIAGGLYRTPEGFRGILRTPAKRADLPPEFALHAPPAGKPGSLPFLEPTGVVYSQSFYLDLATLWSERKKLLNDQQLIDFEKTERDISRVLPGTTVGKLLEMTGPYHRLVAANRSEKLYKLSPETPYPPAALVSSMRDPFFGKAIATAIRAGALLTTLQTRLKMSESEVDGVKIVSYRFPEDRKLADDPENLRFNAVPSFAIVGEYLVVSSSPGLIGDLIPELKKPMDAKRTSPAIWRAKGFGTGAADFLRAYPDPLISAAVLRDGIGLDEAKKQVADLTAWLATLGTATVEIDHQTSQFQVQVDWRYGK